MKKNPLGAKIKNLRKQNNMTQAQLAAKVGVTDKAVSKWERELSYPDIGIFPKLADVFGVTIDDLLKECTGEEMPSRLIRIFQTSHDIRTPLHMILCCVDMALTHLDDKELLLRYLENIRVSGEYLRQAVNHVMQVTYLDYGEVQSIDFPCGPDETGGFRGPALPEQSHSSDPYDFSGKRILLAEDLLLNREIVRELLEQTGADVEFAEDGRICLKKLKEMPAGYYDLILTDIQMPNMNGLEATRAIRALEDKEKAAIPIVALSAEVHEKDKAAAFDAGMDDFAEKPVAMNRLFAILKPFLS